jgi:hypothetical protein
VTQPQHVPRGRTIVTCLYVALVPLLAALARLTGHPEYYFDGETQIPATIGRELLHGHFADAVHYQIIVYQGSLIWDALLSAGAYAIFGDHLLAWHAVPLAYFVGLSIAGTVLLRRTVGPWALLFPLLLAAMPFFVKDGFVSGIGGHAPGAFFAVAGLAAAAHANDGRGRFAILAGLLLGFGTWYVRTVLLAIPAAAVLVGGRVRGRLLLGVGLLAFPLLVAWNVDALQAAGTNSVAQGSTEQLLRVVISGVQGTAPDPVPPLQKTLEATGPAVRTILFAQPIKTGTVTQSHRPLAYPGGATWSAAWLVGLVSLPLLLLVPAAQTEPLVRGSMALIALGGAYVGAYALSSLNLDPGIIESMKTYPPLPPGVSGGRYLVPIQGILTLVLAHAIGVVAVAIHPRLAVVLAAPVVVLGLLLAAGDWRYDRDPWELWQDMPPHQYSGAFGPGRGPPLSVHLGCDDPDSESREAHLDAIGRFLLVAARESGDPGALATSIQELRVGGRYADHEVNELIDSLAWNVARDGARGDLSFSAMTSTAFATAERLGPGPGDAYLLGLRRGLSNTNLNASTTELVHQLCMRSPSGGWPLCGLAGEAAARSLAEWPLSAQGIFKDGVPSLDGLERPMRDALLYGAAVKLSQGGLALPVAGLPHWDPVDAQVFAQKWKVRGGPMAP